MLREMLPEEDVRTASTIFNALGSVVRLRILKMLIETKKPLHIKADLIGELIRRTKEFGG
jgi:DNA-binding transcriptional ArsR family regulator